MAVVARPGSRSGKMLCHSRSIWAFWELRSWRGVASSHNWSSPARWICHRCPKTLDCFEFPLCTRLNTCILGSGCIWRVCSLRILGSGALTPSKASCKHLWSWFPVLKIDRLRLAFLDWYWSIQTISNQTRYIFQIWYTVRIFHRSFFANSV